MNYNDYLKTIIDSDLSHSFPEIKIGFEKESIRSINANISKIPHPKSLGASISNKYITTDFSESQLELITPPLSGNHNCLEMLDDIHHYVSHNIGSESLWPFSMPPPIHSENDIPIADFGSSHQGRFKRIYREGLANRYGKSMQAISGFHFNYSLPEKIWKNVVENSDSKLIKIRSEVYFNILRNIYEMNWLLIYLFGASPIIDNSLILDKKNDFKKLGATSSYMPYATSLRMSEFGYSNLDRRKFSVSINSLDNYIRDLRLATLTEERKYLQFEDINDSQLNTSIFQIEAEYYAVARPKSSINEALRMSSNLAIGGVDFIEIRSLDLNPFSRIGINNETVLFLEIFLAFCLLNEAKDFDDNYIKAIQENDIRVAKYGRKKNISLRNKTGQISMRDWGMQTFYELTRVVEKYFSNDDDYSAALDTMKSRLKHSDETISARVMDEVLAESSSHAELGEKISLNYKQHYLETSKSSNKHWEILEKEAEKSLLLQTELERISKESKQSFELFKIEQFS